MCLAQQIFIGLSPMSKYDIFIIKYIKNQIYLIREKHSIITIGSMLGLLKNPTRTLCGLFNS